MGQDYRSIKRSSRETLMVSWLKKTLILKS